MDNYTVYVHVFPDMKVYVGITKQSVNARWGKDGSGYKNQPVYDAIKTYGWNNIEHYIIKTNISYEEAAELETKLIEEYDSINNGYNIKTGGEAGSSEWTLIEYNGNKYTPSELLKFSNVDGLTTHDITTRLSHGWSVEEVLTKPLITKNQLFEYCGKKYTAKELVDISNVSGITAEILLTRLNKHGWSVERAITQPINVKVQPRGIGEKIYEYNGEKYNSYELEQLSSVPGLTAYDITNRIKHHGWDVERAISQPKKVVNAKYMYNGEMYTTKELAKLSPVKGITHHHITDRLACGWSIYDAVNTELKTH